MTTFDISVERGIEMLRGTREWGRLTRETQRMVLDVLALRETLSVAERRAALRRIREAMAADLSNYRGD